ncbi:MAG: METTL5 family protein [Thermoplasmatota archaeon]
MRKRKLEMILSSLSDIEDPRRDLEQYPTPVDLVSDILFDAAGSGDVAGRKVSELGCGNGPFSIGAYLLGADEVIGYDIDPRCIRAAQRNADDIMDGPFSSNLTGRIYFRKADVGDIDFKPERVHTVFMNPPFGSQRKGADRPFIEKAVSMAEIVYSVHNANTIDFLRKEIDRKGGTILSEKVYKMKLDNRYPHHTKDRVFVDVAVLRIGGESYDEPRRLEDPRR